MDVFIITISTNFNKHKKQKYKIVEIVKNYDFFKQVFNSTIFQQFYKKTLKNRKKLLKTVLKSNFPQFQQAQQ